MKGITALSLSILLAGCSSIVVTKNYDQSNSDSPSAKQGILYSIPKQNFEFSIVRSKVTPKKVLKVVQTNTTKKKALTEEIDIKKSEIKAVDLLITKAPVDSDALLELTLKKSLAEIEKSALEGQLATTNTKLAEAKKKLVVADGGKEYYEDKITVEALTPYPGSTRLIAEVDTSFWSSDTLEIKTTGSGLLSGGSATSEGNVDEIIVALANAIGAVKSPPTTDKVSSLRESAPDAPACPLEEVSFKYEIDLSNIGWELDLPAELAKKNLCYSLELEKDHYYTQPSKDADNNDIPAKIITAELGGKDEEAKGLVYPRKGLYRFKVVGINTNTFSKNFYIQAIDQSALGYISLQQGVFATHDYEFDFSDGLLTRYKSVKPSEVVEALAMIPKAAKALISVPTAMLKLRVDYSSEAEALYTKESAVLLAKETLKDDEDKADAGTLLDDDSSTD